VAASSNESSHLGCAAVTLGDSRRFEESCRLRLPGLSLHGLITIEDEGDTIVRIVGAAIHPSHTASHLHKTRAHVDPAVRTAKLAAFSDGYSVSRGYIVLSSLRLQCVSWLYSTVKLTVTVCLVAIQYCPAYGYSVSRGYTVLSSLGLQCVLWLYSTVQLTVTLCVVAIQFCPAYGYSVSRGYIVLSSLRLQCGRWLYSAVQQRGV
jgi:hypothetical protein